VVKVLQGSAVTEAR